jgi:hypothetical protein
MASPIFTDGRPLPEARQPAWFGHMEMQVTIEDICENNRDSTDIPGQ